MEEKFLLGPLEQDVMQCLWDDKEATVKDVHNCLSKKRKIAYTTIMTVMTRLTNKGYLTRRKKGRRYTYKARKSKKQLISKTVSRIADYLLVRFGEDVVFAFLEELEDRGLSENKKKELISRLQDESKD